MTVTIQGHAYYGDTEQLKTATCCYRFISVIVIKYPDKKKLGGEGGLIQLLTTNYDPSQGSQELKTSSDVISTDPD